MRPAPLSHPRNEQAQILAQGLPGICPAKQAPPLELGHHEANEVFISSRNVGRGNDKAVASALDEPLFELITNLFGTADDWIVHTAAAAVVKELPHRWILVAARVHDAVADGLQTGNRRHLLIRECLVHALGREIEVERL